MTSPVPRQNPVWAELVQLVPVVTLASSFLVSGEVDLVRAGPLFVVAAALTLPVTGAVVAKGHVPNPILLGTALWLWLGAVAFTAPVPALAAWLGETRAVGLFAASLLVGAVATLASPTGYLGARHPDPGFVRRASALLLALTIAAIAWSWTFRAGLRLGAGLPFVALNVARRVTIARGVSRGHRG